MFSTSNELNISGKTPAGIRIDVYIKTSKADVPAADEREIDALDVAHCGTAVLVAVRQALAHLTEQPEEKEAPFRVIDFNEAKRTLEAAEKGEGD